MLATIYSASTEVLKDLEVLSAAPDGFRGVSVIPPVLLRDAYKDFFLTALVSGYASTHVNHSFAWRLVAPFLPPALTKQNISRSELISVMTKPAVAILRSSRNQK